MRAVAVDQDARGVGVVVGVAAEVSAPIHDDTFPTGGGEAFGDHQAGKARADDQEVGGGVSLQGAGHSGIGPSTLPPLVDLSARERNLGVAAVG